MKLSSSLFGICLVLLVCFDKQIDAGKLSGKVHDENSFIYYLYEQMYASCFGESYMKTVESEYRKIFGLCYAKLKASDPEMAITNYYQEESHMMSHVWGYGRQSEWNQCRHQGGSTCTPRGQAEKEPHYTAEVIRNLKNEVFKAAQIIACFFEEMKLTVSAFGRVDDDQFLARFVANYTEVPEQVKGFYLESAKQCQRNSDRGDYMKWGAAYANFHKLMNYFRCLRRSEFDSCMKYDLLKNEMNFELAGLDNDLHDLKLEDKLQFIVSAYANWDDTGVWDM